jgi:hypothetical protein
MLAKVAGKDTQTVVSALIKQAKKLPKELYKSLTWDRGKELTDHRISFNALMSAAFGLLSDFIALSEIFDRWSQGGRGYADFLSRSRYRLSQRRYLLNFDFFTDGGN